MGQLLKLFFLEIEYIILQKYFGSGIIESYKRAFKKDKKNKIRGDLKYGKT